MSDDKNGSSNQDEGISLPAKNMIAVMSGKGGVGKSTISTNLAVSISRMGKKVGIMDADLHGPDIPKMLGVEGSYPTADQNGKITPISISDNLSAISMGFLLESDDQPVIWRGPLKMGAIKQFINDVTWGELDFLIIDLPPGTGDEALSVAQLVPENSNAVIVTTPQEVALLDSRKAINFAKKLGMNVLGVVENMSGMVCPHCGKKIDLFGKGGGRKAATELDVPFLGEVPIIPSMVKSGDEGRPAVLEDGGASISLAQVAENVLDGISKVTS
jgi:Mrp family chromosome partitioning ATPase